MDVGEESFPILAHASCIWAHARAPPDNTGSSQKSDRVNIHDSINQIQDISHASTESVSPQQHVIQVQVTGHGSLRLFLPNHP